MRCYQEKCLTLAVLLRTMRPSSAYVNLSNPRRFYYFSWTCAIFSPSIKNTDFSTVKDLFSARYKTSKKFCAIFFWRELSKRQLENLP